MTFARYLCAVLLLLCCAAAQPPVPKPPSAQKQPAEQSEQLPTFRSHVNLVNVFATVLDRNGAPVGDLQKNDFEIYEDGVRQDVAVFDRESELPLSIVLALDTSLSTRKDLPLELASARRFVHDILRPIDSLTLYEFDEGVTELVHFSSKLETIDRGINRVRSGTSTSLYDAVYLASQALANRQGRKVLVVITDGGDTTSSASYQDALRAAIESEALMYSIIVVPIEASAGRDTGGEHALIQLSRDTGGKYFYAIGTSQLDEAFRKIDRELRTQYLLAYYPKPHNNYADFRRVEVTVKQPALSQAGGGAEPGYTVRHRTGYYAYKSIRGSQ
jgi:Ca-activated chloride channel homolog